MSALTERVSADLKTAMKEHRELELSVFRMLKAELQKFQADKGVSYEITDDDVVTLVGRLVKQRKEAAEQFAAAGAKDRADSELAEVKVLEAYLPAQLSAEEVERIVIGEPRQPNGQPSENLARVQQFVNRWRKAVPQIPIELYDERFTSVLAHQAMLDGGLRKKARQDKALVDEISATILLQDYMRSRMRPLS